eukprot:TRINITY_DN30161_c0_g1_i1.p1 TRINITY_DN30161_c0_g1~~TRINITY_DN30161_c0_g1_i1.p1  ORF type:complete len:106 (-),score=11.90 TRINITY_DN30161_c0_g1_i1:340-657(-)
MTTTMATFSPLYISGVRTSVTPQNTSSHQPMVPPLPGPVNSTTTGGESNPMKKRVRIDSADNSPPQSRDVPGPNINSHPMNVQTEATNVEFPLSPTWAQEQWVQS